MALRCKVAGHDRDECGVCRRCSDAEGATHEWKDAERERPCFPRKVCERCGTEKEQPDHDWTPSEVGLQCSRCGLKI